MYCTGEHGRLKTLNETRKTKLVCTATKGSHIASIMIFNFRFGIANLCLWKSIC